MGMRENWALFIESTKNKSKGHAKAAQYWDNIGTYMSILLICLSAVVTFMALVKSIPATVVAAFAVVTTMLSAVSAFLRPADRRQMQMTAARKFQELMLRMVRCEEESEYEELWRTLNKAIVDAPFLPKKFKLDVDIDWTMTPEFDKLIFEKEGEDMQIRRTPSPCDSKNVLPGIDNFGYGSVENLQNYKQQHPEGKGSNNEKLELLIHN